MKMLIAGMGTALPEYAIATDEALEYAEAIHGAGGASDTDLRRMRILYRRSGVEKRHSVVLGPKGSATRQEFYPLPLNGNAHGPALGKRMGMYEQEALPLALRAASDALDESGTSSYDITHLVTVSCTGFAAPGVDIGLMTALGLRPTVERTHVGFMGCHGALNGLRVARSYAENSPNARVLLVCVELCSLHYHYQADAGQMVANALFADGAAAVVGVPVPDDADDSGSWRVAATGSCLIPDSQEDMSWRITDHGFVMTLSPRVPSLIEGHLQPWLNEWLSDYGLTATEIGSWAVHPGGPRILEAVQSALGTTRESFSASNEILRMYGNMSSPTLLFIIQRLRTQREALPCVCLGFGPGLMAEASLLA